jgi:hypothetical protein
MASSKSGDSSPEHFDSKAVPIYDAKGEPVALRADDGFVSDTSSLGEEKTFLRVAGEENYIPMSKWEGRHRFDPEFQWDAVEEKQLVRKIDFKICAWVCLTFFARKPRIPSCHTLMLIVDQCNLTEPILYKL